MRERPILFNGDMVRAILEGRKTVTRRKANPQPDFAQAGDTTSGAGFCGRFTPDDERLGRLGEAMPCPFGQPGDRLWVRETWQGPLVSESEQRADQSWWKDLSRYRNSNHCSYRASGDSCEFVDPDGDLQCRWKPSIHMPRWASRILLEVTAVRVERLQDITEEQAQAEGADPIHLDGLTASDIAALDLEWADPATPFRNGFRQLWESLGGDWHANPWVWVIEFKRVEAAHA